jgi:hypothetical protein
MTYPTIIKDSFELHTVKPNLQDYVKMYREFSWDTISNELDWFDKEHINIAHIAIDTHLKTDRRNKKALIWESKKGKIEEYTFLGLSQLSNKFVNSPMFWSKNLVFREETGSSFF